MSNLIKRIDKMITDTIAVGDVETNLAQGSVDVVSNQCPKGQQWCSKTKKCVPIGSGDRDGPRKKRTSESVVSGAVIGSGQTRVGDTKTDIDKLKNKEPDLTTRFNKLLGAYLVGKKE